MAEIGETLREARMRERIDVSEIEGQTKIRAKYLRALENEEWDLLPGPTFVKSFLRTYGDALGLDGRALVEQYKLHNELPGDGPEPIQQAPAGISRRARQRIAANPRQGPSRAYMLTVGAIGALIVVLVVALLAGGGGPSHKGSTTTTSNLHGARAKRHHPHAVTGTGAATAALASVRFQPSAEVYVCLVGDGRTRIPGTILTPTSPQAGLTFHAHRFLLTLGNDHLALTVDGRPLEVPSSSRAIGYAITHTGVRALTEAEDPTCR